jgi:hypothetical protein
MGPRERKGIQVFLDPQVRMVVQVKSGLKVLLVQRDLLVRTDRKESQDLLVQQGKMEKMDDLDRQARTEKMDFLGRMERKALLEKTEIRAHQGSQVRMGKTDFQGKTAGRDRKERTERTGHLEKMERKALLAKTESRAHRGSQVRTGKTDFQGKMGSLDLLDLMGKMVKTGFLGK